MATQCDIAAIRACIGLGNPGFKYANTRHNIGFRCVDEIAQTLGGQWKSTPLMDVAEVQNPVSGKTLYLLKPQTFMNESGKILGFLQKKGIKPEEILVCHDELEKPFGFTGIAFGGSAKGHNGLRSIIGMIGPDFWRLKFGIGRPVNKEDVATYVLSSFIQVENAQIPQYLEAVKKLLTLL
ncbi:MAG: aminoacyl-tRNA hydrolase [Candidatus Babeliales bacterium]